MLDVSKAIAKPILGAVLMAAVIFPAFLGLGWLGWSVLNLGRAAFGLAPLIVGPVEWALGGIFVLVAWTADQIIRKLEVLR